jgi:hypothetical protein
VQDRYAGDIGDYVKFGLLRALGVAKKIGVAWYRFPDEAHNADGRHTGYLRDRATWRSLDEPLFDSLQALVDSKMRLLSTLEEAEPLANYTFSSESLSCAEGGWEKRAQWRRGWFDRVLKDLRDCDLVLADPDNGLYDDRRFRYGRRKQWKSIPLSEVRRLGEGRTCVTYHHNTRRAGGHAREVRHWMAELGPRTYAIRWRPYSPRTFFVTNATEETIDRLREFGAAWSGRVELFAPD